MKVAYLLEGAFLFGGVKVVYQHVRALRQLGVDAYVVCPDPAQDWFPGVEEFFRQVPALTPANIKEAVDPDIVVGTMWNTVEIATQVPGAIPFHLCQCYEGAYKGARELWEDIDRAYRLPAHKLAISPHLVEIIQEKFGQEASWIPQPFQPEVFRPLSGSKEETTGQKTPVRILLCGHWVIPIKGVQWAMESLRPLVHEGPGLQLVRLAIEATEAEIACWPSAERHIHVPPADVPDILRGIDIYIGPSTEVEGFGLPMLEAMGCAKASILTNIGPARSLDPHDKASIKIPVGDARALRSAVRKLRDDPKLRKKLGEEGRTIAEQFTEERSAQALLEAFEAALG